MVSLNILHHPGYAIHFGHGLLATLACSLIDNHVVHTCSLLHVALGDRTLYIMEQHKV